MMLVYAWWPAKLFSVILFVGIMSEFSYLRFSLYTMTQIEQDKVRKLSKTIIVVQFNNNLNPPENTRKAGHSLCPLNPFKTVMNLKVHLGFSQDA